MELSELLIWVLSGGGAPALAYWLIERIPGLVRLQPEVKRYVAFAIAGSLGIAAYCVGVAFAYELAPVGWQAWTSQLVRVALIASGVSQIIHARLKLAAKKRR